MRPKRRYTTTESLGNGSLDALMIIRDDELGECPVLCVSVIWFMLC